MLRRHYSACHLYLGSNNRFMGSFPFVFHRLNRRWEDGRDRKNLFLFRCEIVEQARKRKGRLGKIWMDFY
jgi:hypothetical protein